LIALNTDSKSWLVLVRVSSTLGSSSSCHT
jgi:hypothetical protein